MTPQGHGCFSSRQRGESGQQQAALTGSRPSPVGPGLGPRRERDEGSLPGSAHRPASRNRSAPRPSSKPHSPATVLKTSLDTLNR